MKTGSKGVVVTLFMLILFVNDAAAVTGGLRFLLWRPSASATALGGSGVASYNGGFSLYYNPALLTETEGLDISGSYVKPMPFFENIMHNYNGVVLRLDNMSALGISGNLNWRGGMLGLTEVGNTFGADAGAYLFTGQFKAAYAREIIPGVSLGAAVSLLYHKFINGSIRVGAQEAGPSLRAWLFDLGIHASNLLPDATRRLPDRELPQLCQKYCPDNNSSGLAAGLSLLNLGPKVIVVDAAQAAPPPSLLLAGLSWYPSTSNWLQFRLALEVEKQLAEPSRLDYIRSGAELNYMRMLLLRAGYVMDTDGYRNSYRTWGVGLLFKNGSLNVSRYNASLLSTWHFDLRFSWSFS